MCKRIWFADSPQWMGKLPKRFTSILPAFLTYKKAICKSVLHELRRTGKSPSDMANQVNELMHLKYEQAHLAYLHSIQNIWDAEAGVYRQMTLGHLVRKDDMPQSFGAYEDADGWCEVSVSAHYLTDCLIDEYRRQEPAITTLLQGTFGQVLRSDHTRKVARKVTLSSGTMSSYAVMNENWMIVSWVMLQSEREKSLEPMYRGLYSSGTLPPSESSSSPHTPEPPHSGPSVVVPPLTLRSSPHTPETPHTGPSVFVAPPAQRPDLDISTWTCSYHQKVWMKTGLQSLGLWPGSHHMLKPGNALSLCSLPPQPELTDTVLALPSRNFFQLHPFFIWKPESDSMVRLRNNYILPCLHGCPKPDIVSAGVGRPRVIVGTSGQYYIFASRLRCRMCKRIWFADSPQWMGKLPKRFTSILPAFLTYKKAICKSVLHELRRTGKSPSDMANQVNELMHLKYEQAHLAYLHSIQNIWDAEAGVYRQMTLGHLVRKDDMPQSFGAYEDADGWCEVSVSAHYLTDCLIDEYRRQEPAITTLLQGTFGQVLRSDHTRKVARKVTLSSGTMSSYAVMNENWMIVSWVMVQYEREKSLEPLYQGLAKRYNDAGVEKANYHWVDRDYCAPFRIPELHHGEHLEWDAWSTTQSIIAEATAGPLENTCASRTQYNPNIVVKLDLFHCMRRFTRKCTSEHHPLYSTFCQLLSTAFSVVDQEDLQKLKDAYQFCGIQPPNPTKQHIREHCRTKIPQPTELVDRVEKVLRHFHLTTDQNNLPLFKPSMLKTWRIQRVHILRGCLSDPEVTEGIL
ncbi:uncharacterized protein LOC107687771 [Sinocyclocheilus anshuiensis]|uniref:uncharacterized protein LOC107687771 n=1 Tax=Sinocyclocheilus anshuiensis TaxID=1608454 RepID=UPI0007B7D704|nr:PREDICTED: uncharacterized protein LOC107687771 [Sinocyclocheilus anshuiensis]